MKKRPKLCFKTVAILACIAALMLSVCVVVADVVMTRLVQASIATVWKHGFGRFFISCCQDLQNFQNHQNCRMDACSI